MFRRTLLSLWVLLLLATPVAALAAPASTFLPLVPCGGTTESGAAQPPCTPCFLFQAVKNVTDLVLYGITGPLAAFMFVVAGGMFLLGAGNPKMQTQARTLFTNTMLGVGVILISWLATDFLLKSLGGGSSTDRWYEFTCPEFLAGIKNEPLKLPEGYGVAPAPASIPAPFTLPKGFTDATAQAFATMNGEPFPAKSSSTLLSLIDCIYNDPVVKAMTFPKPATTGKQVGNFTYDNDYKECNYTRGFPLLGGACSHGARSCHYGGLTGKDGAEAVDLNALEKNVTVPGKFEADGRTPLKVMANEANLFCELYRVLIVEKKCSGFKFLNWEDDHSHISTKSCDLDGKGVSTSLPPGACKKTVVPAPSGVPAPSSNP